MDGLVSSDESMTVDSPVEVSSVFSKCVEHSSISSELVEKKFRKTGQLTSSEHMFLLYKIGVRFPVAELGQMIHS